jgi:hypothetical protein
MDSFSPGVAPSTGAAVLNAVQMNRRTRAIACFGLAIMSFPGMAMAQHHSDKSGFESGRSCITNEQFVSICMRPHLCFSPKRGCRFLKLESRQLGVVERRVEDESVHRLLLGDARIEDASCPDRLGETEVDRSGPA